jgi:hypothetical protein
VKHRVIAEAVAAIGVAGLVAMGATAAASAGVKPADTSPGCTASFGACTEPVVAQASTGSEDLTPEYDYGLTYVGADPVTGVAYGAIAVDFNNDLENGTQDWAWVQIDTVPHHDGRLGAYNFTPFDNHNYGGDPVFELEYAPNGVATNFCATVTSKYGKDQLRLGNCASAAQQAFIVTGTAPGLEAAPGGYEYALQVSHSSDIEEHNAILDPDPGLDMALVVSGNPPHVAGGKASPALWSSIS